MVVIAVLILTRADKPLEAWPIQTQLAIPGKEREGPGNVVLAMLDLLETLD